MDSLDFELPILERLVQGIGSLTHPVHDISFSGLQFSYATWNDPSTSAGFADVQSNLRMTLPPTSGQQGNQGMCGFSSPAGSCPWGALTQPLANIAFSGAENITISNNKFKNLGGAALGFMYGSSYNLIDNNKFTNIASTALLLGCTYDPTPTDNINDPPAAIKQNCSLDPSVADEDTIGMNEVMYGNIVSNNEISYVGTDYPSACGITLLFSRNTSIVHNRIHDVPYTAITAGVIQGHVDNMYHPQSSTNINADNVISNNLIYNYLRQLSDGGAIYVEGHQAKYYYQADGVTIDPVATLAHGFWLLVMWLLADMVFRCIL